MSSDLLPKMAFWRLQWKAIPHVLVREEPLVPQVRPDFTFWQLLPSWRELRYQGHVSTHAFMLSWVPRPLPKHRLQVKGALLNLFLPWSKTSQLLGSKGHSSFSFTENTAAILSPARLPQARFPPAPHFPITNPCLPTRSLPPGNSPKMSPALPVYS